MMRPSASGRSSWFVMNMEIVRSRSDFRNKVPGGFIEVHGFRFAKTKRKSKMKRSLVTLLVIAILNLLFPYHVVAQEHSPDSDSPSSSLPVALNFTLISGSEKSPLTLRTAKSTIIGNVHTNHNFEFKGSNLFVDGSIVAVNKVDANAPKTEINSIIEHAHPFPMFDAGAVVKTIAGIDAEKINTDKQYNGSKLTFEKSLMVKGRLTFNGSLFQGKGYIISGDDMTFNVSSVSTWGKGRLVLFSENGDITIRASKVNLNGIIYAPNGTVTINSANININGSIIAERIEVSGSEFHIAGQEDDLQFLNGYYAADEYRQKFEHLLSQWQISEYSLENFQPELDGVLAIYESGLEYERNGDYQNAFNTYVQACDQLEALLQVVEEHNALLLQILNSSDQDFDV